MLTSSLLATAHLLLPVVGVGVVGPNCAGVGHKQVHLVGRVELGLCGAGVAVDESGQF